MKRKIRILLLMFVLAFSLTSCAGGCADKSSKTSETKEEEKDKDKDGKEDASEVSVGDGAVLELTLDINKSKGNAISYLFLAIADLGYEIKEGDTLEYDVMLKETMHGIGHVDANFTDGTYMRDYGVVDQNGIACHPMGDIGYYAGGEWYHRSMMIGEKCVGKTIDNIQLAAHPDADAYTVYENGTYTVWYDNIRITNNGKTALEIFANEEDKKDLSAKVVGSSEIQGKLSMVTFKDGVKDEASETVEITVQNSASGSGTSTETAVTDREAITGDVLKLKLNINKDASSNLSYLFMALAEMGYKVKAGDVIEYDVMLNENMHGVGHVDATFTDGTHMRDYSVVDSGGANCHPMGDLSYYAAGKWYHRSMQIGDKCAGKTIDTIQLAAHPDASMYSAYANGTYTMWYDNIKITNNGKTVAVIFADAKDVENLACELVNNSGMTPELSLVSDSKETVIDIVSGSGSERKVGYRGGAIYKGSISDTASGDVLKLQFDVTASKDATFSHMFLNIASLYYNVQKGDIIEYDVILLDDITGVGHVDANLGANIVEGTLRDSGVLDNAGIDCHPSGDLSDFAYGKVYHRSEMIGDKCAGNVITEFQLAAHPGAGACDIGTYTVLYDNIRITNNGKTKLLIFADAEDYSDLDISLADTPRGISMPALSVVDFETGDTVVQGDALYTSIEGAALQMTLDVNKDTDAEGASVELNIATLNYRVRPGDVIEYDVMLKEDMHGIGGINAYELTKKNYLSIMKVKTSEGTYSCHPKVDLSDQAYGKSYHRSIVIGEDMANFILRRFNLAAGPEVVAGNIENGTYTVWYDNIRITNNGETKLLIFADAEDYDKMTNTYSCGEGMTASLSLVSLENGQFVELKTNTAKIDGGALQTKYKVTKEDSRAYYYMTIATPEYVVQDGDVIEYDVMLKEDMHGFGHVDGSVVAEDGTSQWVRSLGVRDNSELPCRPSNDISAAAYGNAYHRVMHIGDKMTGKTLKELQLAAEPVAAEGTTVPLETYTVWYDNIRITNNGVTKLLIFADVEDYEKLEQKRGLTRSMTGTLDLVKFRDGQFVGYVSDMDGEVLQMKYEVTGEESPQYYYQIIAAPQYVVQAGDVIEYDVMLKEDMYGLGHVGGRVDESSWIRSYGVRDTSGMDCFPANDISDYAYEKPYHRVMLIGDKLAGKTINEIQLSAQLQNANGIPTGTYTVWYDNIRITNNGVTKLEIFADAEDYTELETSTGLTRSMTGTLDLVKFEDGQFAGYVSPMDGGVLQMKYEVTGEQSPQYYYQIIAAPEYVVQAGDVIEYDVMLKEDMYGLGHVGGRVDESSWIRSYGVRDTSGMDCFPANDISDYAYEKPYHRVMLIGDKLAGKTINEIQLSAQLQNANGIPTGTYTVWYDNIRITNNGVTKLEIFADAEDYTELETSTGLTRSMTGTLDLVTFEDGQFAGYVSPMDGGVLQMEYEVTKADTPVYYYMTIATPEYEVQEGDVIEYDVMLNEDMRGLGHIDGQVVKSDSTTAWIRSYGVRDANGMDCFPANDISDYAYGKPYHRVMLIGDKLAGNTINYLQLAAQQQITGSETTVPLGTYTVWYDNIRITNNGVTKLEIFADTEDYTSLEQATGLTRSMTGVLSLVQFKNGQLVQGGE